MEKMKKGTMSFVNAFGGEVTHLVDSSAKIAKDMMK